jgi:hypothetical protein
VGLFAGVFAAAANHDPRALRNETEQPLGAGSGTDAAPGALVFVDDREMMDHRDGAERTGTLAVAKAHAAELAIRGPGKCQIGGGAAPVADIRVFFIIASQASGAVHHGHGTLDGSQLLAGDLGYRLGHGRFPGETQCRGNIRVRDHRFGIGFAPGEAAGASLPAGQKCLDRLDFRVDFDREFMGGQPQPDAEKNADAPQNGQASQGQVDVGRVHWFPRNRLKKGHA